MPRPTIRYGEPNWDLIGRWLALPSDEDGPWWALNLMQYREVADYGDDRPAVSGREADDTYAPLGPLAAVGALVAFHGDVAAQPFGEPAWDRVGIVRYPSRASFFAMQQRDDFQELHVHKEAGMAFTINASLLPTRHDPAAGPGTGTGGSLVFVIWRDPAGAAERVSVDSIDGVAEVAAFTVEGVVLGDGRAFDAARFVRVADEDALGALVGSLAAAAEAHVLVLAADPRYDLLVHTIETAGTIETADTIETDTTIETETTVETETTGDEDTDATDAGGNREG